MVTIRILSFASASDAIGRDELRLSIDDATTVDGLCQILDRQYPGLSGLWDSLAIAVDGEIVTGDRVLSEGAEVALLPPVSGGSGQAASDSASSNPVARDTRPPRLTEQTIDLEPLRRSVERSSAGAVVLFIGNVRNHHQGRDVARITYSAYRSMAERRLEGIERDLAQELDGSVVCIVHRLGDIEVGEASIVIATSSAHREQAYLASRQALERVKAEVPIWKREHYRDGDARWREEERLEVAGS